MPIDRTVFDASIDDSASGTDGTIGDKAWYKAALLDPIDDALATVTPPGITTGGGAVTGITFPAVQVPAGMATLDDYEEGAGRRYGGSGGKVARSMPYSPAVRWKIGGSCGSRAPSTYPRSAPSPARWNSRGFRRVRAAIHSETFPGHINWYNLATALVTMGRAVVLGPRARRSTG